MSTASRRCPVCRRPVRRTSGDNITAHRDSNNKDDCPMSGHPYTLTEIIGDTAEVITAKSILERNGYTVLRTKSWQNTLREFAIARSEVEWARKEADRTHRWAEQELGGRIRQLSDRVTYLYGVARARGASAAELAGKELRTA